jgi:hypothetical protein
VIRENQQGIDWLHAQYMASTESAAPPRNKLCAQQAAPVGDDLLAIIRRSKSGAEFERLYGGDAGPDHSAADLRLCSILAFFTGRDAAQIDATFRRSGLMREKWDRKHGADGRTYGQMTVNRAVAECGEVYTGKKTAKRKQASDAAKAPPTEAAELAAVVSHMNSRHGVVSVQGKALIINRDYDPSLNRKLLTLSAPSDIKILYANRKVRDPAKNQELVDWGTYWLEHPDRRDYRGILFEPGGCAPDGYLNLWMGWGVVPKKGDPRPFLDFLFEVICNRDGNLFTYIEDWLCHLFQRPAELPGTAIALRGRQGTGKNTLVGVLGALVGANHYVELTSLSQVTGRFNGHLADALLVFANEAVWGGDRAAEGTLKAMITDPLQPMEKKGRDIVMLRNFKRLFLASNEEWIVPRGVDDRRFVIVDVPETRRNDHRYFGALAKWRERGLPGLLWHFQNAALASFNPRCIPERIAANGWELKLLGAGTIWRWWHDLLVVGELRRADGSAGWSDHWPCAEAGADYRRWCDAHRISHPESLTLFGRTLRQFGIERQQRTVDGQPRTGVYALPKLDPAREIFSALVGKPLAEWRPPIVEDSETTALPARGCNAVHES